MPLPHCPVTIHAHHAHAQEPWCHGHNHRQYNLGATLLLALLKVQLARAKKQGDHEMPSPASFMLRAESDSLEDTLGEMTEGLADSVRTSAVDDRGVAVEGSTVSQSGRFRPIMSKAQHDALSLAVSWGRPDMLHWLLLNKIPVTAVSEAYQVPCHIYRPLASANSHLVCWPSWRGRALPGGLHRRQALQRTRR